MKIGRVSLTKDEAQWFSRNILKMTEVLEGSARKDKGILERGTYKLLKSMNEIATALANPHPEAGDAKVEIILSRKQKLCVRELIGSVYKTLVNGVIPKYKEQAGRDEYLQRAEDKAKALESMMRKFK